MQIRIGQGIDFHRFVEGRRLVLGGVEIPYERGLEGHSDADVLLHAVMDALLGACGKEDIGHYFPSSDERWRSADSSRLLQQVWGEISKEGYKVINLDCTLLLEEPKVAKFIPEMKRRIAEILDIEADQVGIKATTTEKLGAIGRGEGIAAWVSGLVSRSCGHQE